MSTIGSVEKYITDTAWAEGWVEPIEVGPARGQSVGIIGAGPGGLTAAEYLRVAGYDVHVYDRNDRMGGLLTYGIPGFKLEKDVVMRRVERLAEGGVVFHPNFEVGRDAIIILATWSGFRSTDEILIARTRPFSLRPTTPW